MKAMAEHAASQCRIYFTGGASAVLEGWRAATVDADIEIVPDSDRLLQHIPGIKEALSASSLGLFPPDRAAALSLSGDQPRRLPACPGGGTGIRAGLT
jgi:hypothetical protein